jgi:hypothetical protein
VGLLRGILKSEGVLLGNFKKDPALFSSLRLLFAPSSFAQTPLPNFVFLEAKVANETSKGQRNAFLKRKISGY